MPTSSTSFFHSLITSTNLHEPKGTHNAGVKLTMSDYSDAYVILHSGGSDILRIDTSDDNVVFGATTVDLKYKFIVPSTTDNAFVVQASDGDNIITAKTISDLVTIGKYGNEVYIHGQQQIPIDASASAPIAIRSLWQSDGELQWGILSSNVKLTSDGEINQSLDSAYNVGRSVTVDEGAVNFNIQTDTSGLSITSTNTDRTNALVNINLGATTFTAATKGLRVDFSSSTAINSAADVLGIQCLGRTNAGASDSVAMRVDANWDRGIDILTRWAIKPKSGGAFVVADATTTGGTTDTVAVVTGVTGTYYLGGQRGVYVGDLARSTSTYNDGVAIGYNARVENTGGTSIGSGSRTLGINSLALGYGAIAQYNESIALGPQSTTGGPNECSIGGTSATISALYVGRGSSAATVPAQTRICCTSGLGAGGSGSNMILAAGTGGTAYSGSSDGDLFLEVGLANRVAVYGDGPYGTDDHVSICMDTSGTIARGEFFETANSTVTAGAGATVIWNKTIPNNDDVVRVEIRVVANDGVDAAAYGKVALFRRTSGSSAQVGTTQDLHTDIEGDATWDATLTLHTTDNNIRLVVTPDGTNDTEFSATIRYQYNNET